MKFIGSEFEFVNDNRFIRPLISYVNEFCNSFGIEKKDREEITLSLEEALLYAIDNFFDEKNSKIKIILILEETLLRIIIKDKGLPMDPASLPKYSINIDNDEELANLEGIGIFIIKKLMDEVEFKNLGIEGKEWHLVKKFSGKRIDNLISEDDEIDMKADQETDISQIEYKIRPFKPMDAIKISKLAYFTYGYSYSDYIYYPEQIIKMVENGSLISNVAVTEDGEIIGHLAFEFYDSSNSIPELGVAFTNPKYRGHKVFHNLNVSLIDKAKEIGLKGFFVNAVTAHIASQKGASRYGLKPTGLNLGILPQKKVFKKLTGEITQRLSTLTMFSSLYDPVSKNIFIPEKYTELIEEIYDSLSLKRDLIENVLQKEFLQKKGLMNNTISPALNVAFMKVMKYGEDTIDEIISKWKYYKLEKISVIYLYLNLEDEHTPYISKKANEIGFIYSGIIPEYLNGNDILILQYTNNMKVDFEKIKVADEESKKILDFIKAEYEQTNL